ncbi:MAG: NAD(P)-dependent glycerol-1-phosphate dehydrogenase [Candidatus Jordarchaeales archaeon]
MTVLQVRLPVHKMELPRKIVVGRDVIYMVGDVCKKLGLMGSALIVSGPKTSKIAGEKVSTSLYDAKISSQIVIIEESTMKEVEKVRAISKKVRPQLIIGVGGGKSIDVAKLSAHLEGLPFISVPTAASHDGIASPRASIKDTGIPHSLEAATPIAIIADTNIIGSSPYRLTAAGCGDVIANITSVKDWELAYKLRNEYFGEYAASLAKLSGELILQNAHLIARRTENSLRTVIEALISSGVSMGIAGSSRPTSGAEHMFSHALDMIAPKPALHGEQCGVGAIMMMYLHGGDWQAIRDALKTIGAPVTAKELGIDAEYIIEALCIAHKIRPERYTILGEKGIDREAAIRLATITGVIT